MEFFFRLYNRIFRIRINNNCLRYNTFPVDLVILSVKEKEENYENTNIMHWEFLPQSDG